MIWGVRTTAGQEMFVAELLAEKAKKLEGGKILSVIVPPSQKGVIKGYILVEATDELTLRRLVRGTPHAKGVVPGAIPVEEIEPLLKQEPLMKELKVGQIVKIVGGPFKGMRAKILRVDPQKEEVTVELLEAAIKIPVTIEAANVVIEEKGEEG
ncbi:MAG: transcription elongation factor Spt5 [Candidatus Diapherotrites archaeon]|nr:transcription elongation factor Spt5 [Candidatus Diapherotrites archaeon]